MKYLRMTRVGSHIYIDNPLGESATIEQALRDGSVTLGRDKHRVLGSGKRADMCFVRLGSTPLGESMDAYLSHYDAYRLSAETGCPVEEDNINAYDRVPHGVSEPIAMSISHFNRLPVIEHLKKGEAKDGWWARREGNYETIFILFDGEWVEKDIDMAQAA